MTRIDSSPEAMRRLDEILSAPCGRRVGVLGLGIAGRAMAALLVTRGARVVGADLKPAAAQDDLAARGVELRIGPMGPSTFADVDLVVVSPGADPRQAAVAAARDRGVPICGELELVHPLPAKVAAITGTNGKSTTTALLGALVTASGAKTFVGGNLGEPIAGWVASGTPAAIAVIELSSFQLETAYRFRADVGVMLNVTPDHFDRYPDVDSYALTKRRLLENMDQDGVAVLSADDPRVVAMASVVRGRALWFSTTRQQLPGDGAYLRGDVLTPTAGLASLGQMDLAHPRLFGRHNRENALAALLAAYGLGVLRPETGARLSRAYQEFTGLEHRLELVADVGGVRYINDSKATNDDAAAVALMAMDRPVVLLAGGRDKGAGYRRLVQTAAGKVKAVIAFGEAQELLAAAFAPNLQVSRCAGMRSAFTAAVSLAVPGDVVLLAPACSSFDEFTDYKHRGREFKRLVHDLAGGKR
ncbi:MAG: UDP-N-acetylmuramoyl-L-alanine--D-glutamate ligase [Deltaproteobacteria bacterium]|nr:UDP-N-acetylmuramoyl-L-alanine--D-glutamate ligase [Deltaproteobacteria bacterium]